jgi:Mn2+/Fe2+ NRAMP family transporter
MLYSTQLGVLESSSRIISENIALSQKGIDKPVNLSLYFYLSLWFQISLGVILLLLGVEEPRFLLTLSAVLNAFAMTISFPLIYILNKKRLSSQFQPSRIRKAVLLLAFVFFVIFDFLVIKSFF